MRYHVYDRDTQTEFCYDDEKAAYAHADRIENCTWGRRPCDVLGCDTRALMPQGRYIPSFAPSPTVAIAAARAGRHIGVQPSRSYQRAARRRLKDALTETEKAR